MRQGKKQNLTILIVTHAFGVPPRAGNELRIARLALWLRRQGHEVHIALKTSPAEAGLIPREWEGILIHHIWTHAPPESSRSLEDQVCPTWFKNAVESAEVLLQPDVVIAEYVLMSKCLLGSKAALKVIDTHDVFSRRKEKIEKFGIRESYFIPAEVEAQMLSRADALIAIQAEEARVLRKLAPGTVVLTCGVDFDEELALRPKRAPRARHALIVASDNPANRLGVSQFLSKCWPLIRKQVPGAKLLLAGAIGQSIRKAPAGVKVLGVVDELAPLYRQSAVALNPIEAGTGLKIKSVEALAYGLPLISFENGLEGVPSSVAGACFLAQDWENFARETARLLSDPIALKSSRVAAKKLAAKSLGSRACYRELDELLRSRFAEREGSSATRSSKTKQSPS